MRRRGDVGDIGDIGAFLLALRVCRIDPLSASIDNIDLRLCTAKASVYCAVINFHFWSLKIAAAIVGIASSTVVNLTATVITAFNTTDIQDTDFKRTGLVQNEPHIRIHHNVTNNFFKLFMGQRYDFLGHLIYPITLKNNSCSGKPEGMFGTSRPSASGTL